MINNKSFILLFCQDATKICDELGLCNSTKKAVDVVKAVSLQPAQKIEKNEIKNVKSPAAGPQCVICEFVMKELDSILGDNTTKVCVCSYDGKGIASHMIFFNNF